MIASQLRNHVRRNRRRICERFIEVPRELVDNRTDVWRHKKLVMICSKLSCSESRKFQFVVTVFMKADRESLYWLAHVTSHQCDNCARIDSTREERSERHIGNQTQSNRFIEEMTKLGETVFFLTTFVQ